MSKGEERVIGIIYSSVWLGWTFSAPLAVVPLQLRCDIVVGGGAEISEFPLGGRVWTKFKL